jgi:hypothetical protein
MVRPDFGAGTDHQNPNSVADDDNDDDDDDDDDDLCNAYNVNNQLKFHIFNQSTFYLGL